MDPPKERRHAFRSFKERIDSMKIEPHRKLNTRAHDYVETSHFLATLEHWKEVNISGDFTDFLREVEPLCQTLPQILHHQSAIFASLKSHIVKNDVHSIQPLLELLGQFVHDLGPDFMPFYLEFLRLVMELAQSTNPNESQNMRNTSNVLEWCFNTLAFAFKYLSRVLTEDLKPTFIELMPVLHMTKKTYVSRFCAEALSFLVKKSKPQPLHQIVVYSFNENRSMAETNKFYRESLVVLYSEAMKNTQDTFHSKAITVFRAVLENALATADSDICVNILCDILLQAAKHGSAESCERFFAACMAYLSDTVSETSEPKILYYTMQILLTMAFAESGWKVRDWTALFALVESVSQSAQRLAGSVDQIPAKLMSITAHLFAVIVRNCPSEHLFKRFAFMSGFLSSVADISYFLSFYELAAASSAAKLTTYQAPRALQAVINKTTNSDQLSVLAQKLSALQSSAPECIAEIVLPPFLTSQLLKDIDYDIEESLGEAEIRSVFSKLKLLEYAPTAASDSKTPLAVLRKLAESSVPQSPFLHDAMGTALSVAVKLTPNDAQAATEIYQIIKDSYERCRESGDFMSGATQFVKRNGSLVAQLVAPDVDAFALSLAPNFSLAGSAVRLKTAEFLVALYQCTKQTVPSVISQIRIIDQVPLTVANSNDVKMRIRHVVGEFSELKTKSNVDRQQLTHYIVGLLSNNFQPCWLAVYEALPQLAQCGCEDKLWDVLMTYVKYDYSQQRASYLGSNDDSAFEEIDDAMHATESGFEVLDDRLMSNINAAAATLVPSGNAALASLLQHASEKRAARAYNPQLRARVIRALQAVTYVAESHGEEFIDYAIQLKIASDSENTDETPDEFASWTNKDKLALVAVCGKFKRMQKIPGNDKLFALVLQNLSSKQTNVQQESLDILFAWNKQSINKYRDNLKNLLEDKLFRDELQSLVNKNADSKIETADEEDVIPIVLRILYGRAKGASNNKGKNGRKFAIATILPNLPDVYVEKFLAILSQQIDYEAYFASGELPEISKRSLNSMVGYLNMLYEVFNGLGYKFAKVLQGTVRPLTYTLLCSQKVLDSVNESTGEIYEKVARTVRTLGFKCLDHLFKITAATFDWSDDAALIFNSLVKPRLPRFAQENAQQPSSLMGLILGWISSPRLVPFLYMDDYSAVHAVMALLGNVHAKDAVKSAILDFAIAGFTRKDITDENYYTLLAIVVDGLLAVLPQIIEVTTDKDINARASTLLLLIIEGGYVKEHATRKALVQACASAINKPPTQIAPSDRVSLLLSLVSILDGFECAFDDIVSLYEVCSAAFRTFKDRNIREALVQIFGVIGTQFSEYAIVAELLAELNANSTTRMVEPDFERRLKAFKQINEELYETFTPMQWLPIVQACLFFINDPDELAIRSNASYTLTRFFDGLANKTLADINGYRDLFYAVIVPQLRAGLKKDNDEVKDGYIHVLATAVRNYRHFPEFESMSVLLSEDPDEDFFKNFTHIQLKCRQQAIRSLIDFRTQLSPECIHHYILPMTESYTSCTAEKMRPLLDDTHATWASLVSRLRWDHFRVLLRKFIGAARQPEEVGRRDRIRLVIHLSHGMLESFRAFRAGNTAECFTELPENFERTEALIMRDFFEPIMKVVRVREDDTVVDRTLLVEAAVNCLLCVSESAAELAIPGTLTSTCQALRSKYQPTRDGIRRTLCKVTRIVGAKYFKFIVQELKTALSRGAQIHVLSYTLHAVLAAVREDLEQGDLDDSASLIVDIVMEDIFGAAGQDKDAEDYVSSMREVKSKKSFETAEVLCSNISLSSFTFLVEPIKMLLKVNIPLKTKRKLDDLLVKYARGIMFNPAAKTRDILVLCYELHQQSTSVEFYTRKQPQISASEEHFMVRTSSRPTHMNVDKSQVRFALQKFCFELMRSALGKQPQLLTVANIDGFVPLMQSSLEAEDEGLLVALYKILDLVVKLDFDESRNDFFTETATRAFNIIQNLTSTASELSQTCLRYLATLVRHKPAVKLSDRAMTYLLVRILPDLEDPEQQGLAFNFLKAVLFRHTMLPEVYEVMDKVSSILVVNHNKEIRDMSRALYFQFLMEYEQGPAKLEKAFKFMVNNLAYPTQSGRESVMELMHSIILKSSETLLAQLATSFFVGLANVAVADDIAKCREMASALVARLFKKVGQDKVTDMENFIYSWMTQDAHALLKRCGLSIYKVYISVFGVGASERLDSVAFALVESIVGASRNGATQEIGSDAEAESEWENVYTAMSVFSGMCNALAGDSLTTKFEPIWRHVLESILYPHTWVRLLASRLVGVLLGNLEKVQFSVSPEQLQTIAYRHLRQLGAPQVAPDLGNQVVKNMIQILTKWNTEETPFCETAVAKDADEDDKDDKDALVENEMADGESAEKGESNEAEVESNTPRYASAVDFVLIRVCSIMRQDTRADRNLTARKASIQIGAVISHLVSAEKLPEVARKLLHGMYYILEQDAYTDAELEVLNMAKESAKSLEDKLGVTAYLEVHTAVRKAVDQKRLERRTKRAHLAISAPDVAARRKLKKHGNFREKRKHRKDDNGFYRGKRTKRNNA